MSNPGVTPDQMAEALAAYERCGSASAAARDLGLPLATYRNRLKRAQAAYAIDPGIIAAVSSANIHDLSHVHSGWVKTEGASIYFQMPKPEPASLQDFADVAREAFSDLPPAEPIETPHRAIPELLCAYLFADLHFGLHVWDKQGSANWDLKEAGKTLRNAMGQLVVATPEAETALILNLGDAFHADDQRNVTPKSQNPLDVDQRYPKIALETLRAIKTCIDMARAKHQRVIYAGIPGNHDPHQSHWLNIALMEHYEAIPNVEILWNPGEFFFHEHGRVMLSAHHGDKAKPDRMAHYVADAKAEMWGRTYWRYMHTGHVHHDAAKDIGGLHWESHRTIAPRDAYAHGAGYTGRQTLKAITYHSRKGEVMRSTVAVNYG